MNDLNQISDYESKQVYLDAIGPANKTFFNNLLEHLTLKNIIKIEYVKVRNSPLDVLISLYDSEAIWYIVATLLSTRFKYQTKSIEVISNENRLLANEQTKNDSSPLTLKSEHNLKFGPISEKEYGIEFKYLSVFSNGLSKSLELSFSPQRALELHKHILGFRKFTTKG